MNSGSLKIVFLVFLTSSVQHINMNENNSQDQSEVQTKTGQKTVLLFGDSIFDNAIYVRGRNSVIQLLTKKLSDQYTGSGVDAKAHLFAHDGDVIEDVSGQLKKVNSEIKEESTHIFISCGGNNGLRALNRIYSNYYNPFALTSTLWNLYWSVDEDYEEMMQEITTEFKDKQIVVCTIYKPNFTSGAHQFLSQTGLLFLNSLIRSKAAKYNAKVIDLYDLFTDATFLANPIEPGVKGGDIITDKMMEIISESDNL